MSYSRATRECTQGSGALVASLTGHMDSVSGLGSEGIKVWDLGVWLLGGEYPICPMRADFKPYGPCPYSEGCHEDVCPLKDSSPSSAPLWHLLSHGGTENLGLSYNTLTLHDQTKSYMEAAPQDSVIPSRQCNRTLHTRWVLKYVSRLNLGSIRQHL